VPTSSIDFLVGILISIKIITFFVSIANKESLFNNKPMERSSNKIMIKSLFYNTVLGSPKGTANQGIMP